MNTATHMNRIRFSDTGEGPLLIFIPGLGLNTHIFDALTDRMQSHYRCLCIEFSGDVPPKQARHCSIESLAAEVAAFLQHNRLSPAAVIGHSLGGFIGMRLALLSPELVSRLILLASAAYGENSLFSLFMPNTITPPKELLRRNMTLCVTPAFERSASFDMAVTAQLHHPGNGKCFIPLLRAAARFDIRPDLSRIFCPTLVLSGNEDPVAPPNQADLLTQGLPKARHICLKHVAHLPQLEAPDITANELLHFLQTTENQM